MQIGGSELLMPLACKCTKRATKCVQCPTCGRYYHSQCDDSIRDTLQLVSESEEDDTVVEDGAPPSLPSIDAGDDGMQSSACNRVNCFPCKHEGKVQ